MVFIVAALLAADLNADGFAAYQAGDYEKADELFKKALAANPKHTWARLNRARTVAAVTATESCKRLYSLSLSG
jgi:tetratricopeptide (TPR) repeat protein